MFPQTHLPQTTQEFLNRWHLPIKRKDVLFLVGARQFDVINGGGLRVVRRKVVWGPRQVLGQEAGQGTLVLIAWTGVWVRNVYVH